MIKKVILTIITAALFIVPVSIISLQSAPAKTAEAQNPYPHNRYSQKDCFAGRIYVSAQDTCVLNNSSQHPTNYCYNPCVPYNTNYNTNKTNYSSCSNIYIFYNCSSMNNNISTNRGSSYSYSSDYSYYNSGNYSTQPSADIYVPAPNIDNYKLKDSDSQEYKNSYCQYKYHSTDYVFQNYYCVK
jgi:hypothetical protein